MIGTIVNTACIILGTIAGALLHRGIKEEYKHTLYTALGLASLAIGLNATISHFSESKYPVLFIISLAVGGVVGTVLDIDGRFRPVWSTGVQSPVNPQKILQKGCPLQFFFIV